MWAKNFGETKIELDLGKMSQNENKTHTTLTISVKELYELLKSPGTEFTKPILTKDDVVWLSWEHFAVNITAGKNGNEVVAAYVTTEVRLIL